MIVSGTTRVRWVRGRMGGADPDECVDDPTISLLVLSQHGTLMAVYDSVTVCETVHSLPRTQGISVYFNFMLWSTSTSTKLRGFFFSSRRRHTRLVSDWSSDVCSSD